MYQASENSHLLHTGAGWIKQDSCEGKKPVLRRMKPGIKELELSFSLVLSYLEDELSGFTSLAKPVTLEASRPGQGIVLLHQPQREHSQTPARLPLAAVTAVTPVHVTLKQLHY